MASQGEEKRSSTNKTNRSGAPTNQELSILNFTDITKVDLKRNSSIAPQPKSHKSQHESNSNNVEHDARNYLYPEKTPTIVSQAA